MERNWHETHAAIVEHCRRQFPALSRRVGERPAAFFDGPGGTQVPQRVIEAVSHYLAHTNANHGGLFATVAGKRPAAGRGPSRPGRFSGRGRSRDDRLRPEHDVADVRPLAGPGANLEERRRDRRHAARSRRQRHARGCWPPAMPGRRSAMLGINDEDCTLDLEELRHLINERTKLVAVGCASNATGTINPVRDIADWAHQVGRAGLSRRRPLRPALPDRRAGAGLRFSGLLGLQVLRPARGRAVGPPAAAREAGGLQGPPRAADAARQMDDRHAEPRGDRRGAGGRRISGRSGPHAGGQRVAAAAGGAPRSLSRDRPLRAAPGGRLLAGLDQMPEIKVWGINAPERLEERVATVSFTHERFTPRKWPSSSAGRASSPGTATTTP